MATYLPDPTSTWLAAVRGGAVLVVPASASADLTALWPRLGDDDPTSHVLDRLTSGGLAATPQFALAVRDGARATVRVVVRGELTIRVDDEEVSGAGVSTWTERVLPSGTFEVAATSTSSSDAATPIPVVEAVVPALRVRSDGVEPIAQESRAPAPNAAPASTQARPSASAAASAAASAPASTPPAPGFPPAPPAPGAPAAHAAEQTMVPAEDTIAGPSTPSQPMPALVASEHGELDGDHDGLTVASIDLRRLRAERAARGVDATPAAGVAVAEAARPAPAASPSLRMPDGALEPLGPGVVLGRAPSVSQVSGGRLPRLVTIGAGDPDISRSHVRVSVEGDTVVITDLHSRNGTHVVAPGKAPVKLRAGDPTPVLAGTVVDLGGGWTVQVVGD
ncbi:MAG: FHA domain-containing protein [Actinomycetota bacterium]|nr:FHA domain-containing protein [Actinomycetota bacterium]